MNRRAFDMRLPLTVSNKDCRHIASDFAHCAGQITGGSG